MMIKRIKLENIRSYKEQEIYFKEGSTILAGDIGSGKTSILLAVEFALFGLQPGQKGSALLRNGAEEGSVLLEIEVDNKIFLIERGLKKSKTVNQTHARLTYENKTSEMSVTELKNKVLEILNYPKEFAKKTNLLYRFTVYTPQEEMKQIILESSDVRLDTLRHIFGIDKYKKIQENTELLTAKLRENIRNLEGQIKDLEDLRKNIEVKSENIIKLQSSLSILKNELVIRNNELKKTEMEIKEVENKIKEKEKYEQEIEKTKIMLLGKKEIISSIEKERKNALRYMEEIRKISFSQSDIDNLELEIKNNEKQHEEKNRVYFDILAKINTLNLKQQESAKNKSQLSSLQLCPTCFQNVAEDYKSNVVRKFEEDIFHAKKEILALASEKENTIKILDSIKNSINYLKKNLDEKKLVKLKLESAKEKESRLLELEKENFLLEKDVQLLEKQINLLKDSASLMKSYDLIYEQKKKENLIAMQKEREKALEINTAEKEIEFSFKLIEDIKNQIAAKEKIKEKLLFLQELEYWLSNTFSDLMSLTEKNIMLKLREDFSKLFNEWFNILVPENFSVRLDEDFTPIIEQQDFSLDYSFLSGGERTSIALSYRLALNQVINSLLSRIKTRDLVILDEPTDGFSEQQLDKMRDVLSQLKVQQLIIVSHESKIESFVENIIKFKKQEGITKIC